MKHLRVAIERVDGFFFAGERRVGPLGIITHKPPL